MKHHILCSFAFLVSTAGCEVITGTDRSQIPPSTTASTSIGGSGGTGSEGVGGMGGAGGNGDGGKGDGGDGSGGTGTGGSGACSFGTDCPGSDTECETRTCTDGVCGISFTEGGTPTTAEKAGDCKRHACDGKGVEKVTDDDTDTDDGNPCTDDACEGGVPSHAETLAGTDCGLNRVCDGDGSCVGCIDASDCGTDEECQTHTCTGGVCDVTFAEPGKVLTVQTPKDCMRDECNATGEAVSVVDDSDKPDDSNSCTNDICTDGVLSHTFVGGGAACGNGTATCNGAGQCTGCVTKEDCSGSDTTCQVRTCTAGVCGISKTADDEPCSDGNACTQTDTCQDGVCLGAAPVLCSPKDQCHDTGTCDPDTGGCANPSKDDGSSCSDGSVCTQGDTCQSGVCESGGSVTLSDNNGCTADACDPVTGVSHTPIAVNDSNACTIDACDPATGNVTHTPLAAINDGNACTTDACDPATGNITHTPLAVINDNDACTTDTCNPATGNVTHTPLAAINDGNACTTDACDPATGNTTHTPLAVINDNDACTTDTCNPATGNVTHTPLAAINDGNACTTDACDPATGNTTHTPLAVINDNDACTTDTCNPATGNVTHTPLAAINDNNACTTDACDWATGNVTHTPLAAINDNNACTTDACDPATGNVTHAPLATIDDNDACTTDACDWATGNVTHTPLVCPQSSDEGAECTYNLCNPTIGACEERNDAFVEDFTDNSQGWSLGSQWQIGQATSSSGHTFGFPDPASDYDSPFMDEGVAGVAIGGNAVSTGGVASFTYLTSPVIDLSSLPANETVYLDYWRWLNSAAPATMQNRVEVFDGTTWVLVWQSTGAVQSNAWSNFTDDVSAYKNANFRVRFGFSAAIGSPIVSSWNLDHVRLIRLSDQGC